MNLPIQNFKFAVIGGDSRQIYSAMELCEHGFEVCVYGFDKYDGEIGLCTKCRNISDALINSNAVILPIPVSCDETNLFMPLSENRLSLKELFDEIGSKAVILGGRVGNIAQKFSTEIIDYFDREELVIANAYLTAESAIGIAMSEMKESLKDVNVLVLGYGRIGKILCSLLKGMGVNVYASARKKSDFAWIRAYGYSPVDTSNICSVVSSCRLIFNTIPKLVLGEESLGCMHRDSTIIDLASKPGGVDFSAAKKCGLRVLWALGLPGKKLPVSAGRVEAKTILDILDEMGLIV